MSSIKLSKKHGVNPSVIQCFWCGEDVGIALLGALPGDAEAPRQIAYDYTPCDACLAIMNDGITLMEVSDNRYTGSYVVVTEESLDRIIIDVTLRESIKKSRKALVPTEVYKTLTQNISEK